MIFLLFLLTMFFLVGATVYSNTGKAITTNKLKGTGTSPDYIAWGTGAGTVLITSTTLFTEASETRVQGTMTQQTTTTTSDTFQVVGTMTVAGAGKTITNAGLFDAVSAGNAFMMGDFTGIVLNVGESISFTFKVVFS